MKNCRDSYQKAWGPWERQHTPSAPHDGCIMLAKDRVQVSKIWITGHWLWSWLSYLRDCFKSTKNRTDSALSLRGLEAGLPAFQLPMFAKCDALPKQIKESIPATVCLLAIPGIQSLPAAWGSCEPHCGCIMPIPSLQLQKKDSSHAEKQRVWSRSCGLQESLRFTYPFTDCAAMWQQAFSLRGLEVGLPAFQLPMFAKCDALRNPFPPFVFGFRSIHPLCEAWTSYSSNMLHQLIASCLQKIELWYPSFALQAIDCDLGCLIYATAESQWRSVEIHSLFSLGASANQLPMFAKCDAPLKRDLFDWHACLCKASIAAIPLKNGKHPLPTSSLRFLRAAVRSTGCALRLHHAHPLVAAAEKRPVSCREAEGLVTELWSPRSVTMHWLCSYVTAADWAFKPLWFGSGAASLSATDVCKMWRTKESIPAIRFWISKHPPPTWSLRLLRAATCYTSPALWLHHAHPFVADAGKACLMQRNRGSSHGVVVSKICYNAVIVLSVVLCDCCKPMNNCRDWAFSNIGLEAWLPAFQLPMFAKGDALPQGDFVRQACFRPLFLFWISIIPSPPEATEAWGSWEPRYVPPALH